MATGAAGDALLRGMFEGCIPSGDDGIKRRPYHKNCGCALHKSLGPCAHSSPYGVVSYPIRRSWSEGCLSLMATATVATVLLLLRRRGFLGGDDQESADASGIVKGRR